MAKNRHGIEIFYEEPKPKPKPKPKKVVKQRPRQVFHVGETVRVVDESHGWGGVSKNDTGTVVKVCTKGLEVDFQSRRNWFGTFRCFHKTETSNVKQR